MMRKAWCVVLVLSFVGAGACSGETVGGEDDGQPTDKCAPVCEKRQAFNCNGQGTVELCRIACGLALTGEQGCQVASKALLDCQAARENPCTGCAAERTRAEQMCL